MCLGIIPLFHWGFLPERSVLYFIAVILFLAVFNVFAQGLWPKEDSTRSRHTQINLYVDLLAAAGLLFISGSANNPFISILCIHAFLGGMLLRQKTSAIFGLTVMSLLGLLQLDTYLRERVTETETSEFLLRFLSQWVLVGASWFVSHYFSRLLAKNEERIRVLQDRQHQADRLKALGALTAGFSHQLATPMNSLKLRMERGLRKLEASSEDAREEFGKAKEALDECVNVFEHMASVFSRSSESELQRVEMEQLVPDLLKVWQKENPKSQVEKMIMNESMPCRLQVLSFSHTLFDLLNNAQEASEDSKTFYLRLYKDSSLIYLEVTDQGAGLSKEILSRLGEPFVTSKVHGNGLGLYSASMMAQASGGEFKIYNNASGIGATAQIRLPLEE